MSQWHDHFDCATIHSTTILMPRFQLSSQPDKCSRHTRNIWVSICKHFRIILPMILVDKTCVVCFATPPITPVESTVLTPPWYVNIFTVFFDLSTRRCGWHQHHAPCWWSQGIKGETRTGGGTRTGARALWQWWDWWGITSGRRSDAVTLVRRAKTSSASSLLLDSRSSWAFIRSSSDGWNQWWHGGMNAMPLPQEEKAEHVQ